MLEADKRWQFWIDRGGTFTDIVAQNPQGQLQTHKLLSENPERYQDAALQGIRDILKISQQARLSDYVSIVKMGTTVGTNALLERKGANTALLITRGFKDCLRIGYQNRPDIFALNIQRPELLYNSVLEITERLDAHGQVLTQLDLVASEHQLKQLYKQGIRCLAIVLMHAWRFPGHELQLAEIARQIGFTQISVSHQVSPLMKIISRGDTTVVDAYLSPLLRHYVDQVASGLQALDAATSTRLMFMQSNGGLTEAHHFQGKDSILSGPAGGIVGAVAVASQAGFDKIIAFDMGGTSTDVAHYAGSYERSFETQLAGVRMRAPMMNIHTVAAGGGSVLHFDGMRYRVGPDSAGANPGPASYRRGGPLTVTDANLMLGKLPLFPAVFGEQGDLSLDKQGVEQAFTALADSINAQSGDLRSPQQVAEGFLSIAVENMATAIKKISVQKGYNISSYTLCCFGAAGGQHACKVADRLGMSTILIHPFAGVLSAYGMGLADFRRLKDQAIEMPFAQLEKNTLTDIFKRLQQSGTAEMLEQGVSADQISSLAYVFIRYEGTDTALQIALAEPAIMHERFLHNYQQQFGFVYTDKALVIESVLLEVIGKAASTQPATKYSAQHDEVQAIQYSRIFTNDAEHEAPVYHRDDLFPGFQLTGPAIIIEATATTVLEPGWQLQVNEYHDLILTRHKALQSAYAVGTEVDPVMLEIFNKLFTSIAEQMGFVLQNTAYSVNIKERLDFSCAIFDKHAQLIANAPHIPVHLGSMGESVAALLKDQGANLQAGAVYLLNSPYHGGTHLPDITVVSPVFDESQSKLLFFVASRGHHADVGGITPGFMPPDSQHIEEEGLLSAGLQIVEQGRFLEQKVRDWLSSGPYPARNPEQNIADLQAQVAANEKGVQELSRMVNEYSLNTVQAYMQHVQDNAEEAVRRKLVLLNSGHFRYKMDAGAEIVVQIRINKQKRSACIDFSASSAQLASNFNAPSAVCKAAVLYVFRTLLDDDIPLNAGCLKPLNIIIADNSMLNPQYPAAVVAGNVETSQYIVDALYGALGVLAGSQGSMNNFTFGNAQYQYYETLCGGAGAGDHFNGADAVQTHMTNSRITDPEILEWRFPVLLEEFSIRRNSGGAGKFTGGNGVLRRIKFLQTMTASILSSHRKQPAFGLQGGSAGQPGINTVIKANGASQQLPACVKQEMQAGDKIQIETPGGGGFGDVDDN